MNQKLSRMQRDGDSVLVPKWHLRRVATNNRFFQKSADEATHDITKPTSMNGKRETPGRLAKPQKKIAGFTRTHQSTQHWSCVGTLLRGPALGGFSCWPISCQAARFMSSNLWKWSRSPMKGKESAISPLPEGRWYPSLYTSSLIKKQPVAQLPPSQS